MIMMKTETVAHCDEWGVVPGAKECWTGAREGKSAAGCCEWEIKGGRETGA